jgi:hypothetical protein
MAVRNRALANRKHINKTALKNDYDHYLNLVYCKKTSRLFASNSHTALAG